MKIRLGYVAITLGLPKVTSSSTVTYTNYQKLQTEEQRYEKLKKFTLSNLVDLRQILEYNVVHQIHFYRITSALVPLATHPEVNWEYRELFRKEFESIGNFIKEHNIRVDTHPDQFNVINSVNDHVVKNTLNNLYFHSNLFKDLNYEQGKMVLHVGSGAEGKDLALKRFITNFETFPEEIKSKIILENDDKVFTAKETLRLCKEIATPMVLDVHHHLCNNDGTPIEELFPQIVQTWSKESLPPKFHFSSPREGGLDKKHSDFINVDDFISFIEKIKEYNVDMDIMLEAKKKDFALFDLVDHLKKVRPNWKWLDASTFMC
ncbi:UV-damage endonuclease [Alkalibaculum bacchi]|uniref:UV-damage endonuclease n=1 Tax=Alkalibaculum bacchi TaxID=645887 RepID=A0A366I026_9FIRM|nr:UV DNA damage repair endonuclease UvsE [Alkalibaculum bacchi]RBP59077.1 UV-damage endonuclease [Alkalibaculum bacchi]